jgi:hypothetical protein
LNPEGHEDTLGAPAYRRIRRCGRAECRGARASIPERRDRPGLHRRESAMAGRPGIAEVVLTSAEFEAEVDCGS